MVRYILDDKKNDEDSKMSQKSDEWHLDAPYYSTTRAVTVKVEPTFLADQSSPLASQYIWAYRIRIENHGDCKIQLKHRHWIITDALGQVHEVKGAGVVGEQPMLKPGDAFEYMSGTPLQTPSGIMVGTYQMEDEFGEIFDIAIPAFSLDSPYQPHCLN